MINKLRVLLLSVFILILVGYGLPVTESLAKWSKRTSVSSKKRRSIARRRYNRARWRRMRARERARIEAARLRRERRLAARREALAQRAGSNPTAVVTLSSAPVVSKTGQGVAARPSSLPFDFTPPHTWGGMRRISANAFQFSVRTNDGRPAGTAVMMPLSIPRSDHAGARTNARTQMIGDFPVSALRRTVIDKMVADGGWVANDFVRDIQGRRVFVVIAQTGSPGAPTHAHTFYFTEIAGRVYSLTTNAPVEFAVPVAAGSEQFMASLRTAVNRNVASQE